MTMPRLAVLAALVLVVPSLADAQPVMPPRPDLYKFVNIQAAPGKLPELLALSERCRLDLSKLTRPVPVEEVEAVMESRRCGLDTDLRLPVVQFQS